MAISNTHELWQQAVAAIQSGKLVAFPTETVYGLGADALNPSAVAGIFALKERPSFDPLIVHIAHMEDLARLTLEPDPRVNLLAQKFWPGPLTLVLPKSSLVPDIVTSGLNTVGIRMPSHPVARELIERCGCPIAAPSANKFGRVSPTRAEHVRKKLAVEVVLDGLAPEVGIESTIVALHADGFEVLRHGVITLEDLKQVLPESKLSHKQSQVVAPGMLNSHYSPAKPLYLTQSPLPVGLDKSRGAVISCTGIDTEGYKVVCKNQTLGDLREYAVNIFAWLHQMEEADVDYMVAEAVTPLGIGAAIMDRLRKAAYRYSTGLKNI
jgi:L-threonylcarbamoyladenylate synthase